MQYDPTEINLPEVVAEVKTAFTDYEEALAANDVAALGRWFWDSPQVVRFGIDDQQVGAAQLDAWRRAQPPLPPGRRLFDTRIVTFGTHTAVVSTCFDYPDASTGRQSQTWLRTPQGWRIVHAHVSQPRSCMTDG